MSFPNCVAGEFHDELIRTARKIATPGKGILAADESSGTIASRFKSINIEASFENTRNYRELLFGTKGLNEYISGAILFDETLTKQKVADGSRPLCALLLDQGIVVGIKVDNGPKPLPGSNGESACTGLDGLGDRCKNYYALGARFGKWRAPYAIDLSKGKPSELLIKEQAWGLARYAAVCQANGICPIVEPEVMMDGDHDIETCARVSERVYSEVMKACHENGVLFEGILFKPNMITSGQAAKVQAGAHAIASFTIRTLQRTLPASVPGVTFLSGGQTEEEATLNLDAINRLVNANPKSVPWQLSFSYGRALQATCITTWAGKAENVEAARAVLLDRANRNSEAQLGKYEGGGSLGSNVSLFEKDYIY